MAEWVDDPHVVVPVWMTPQQVEAITELYRRNPDGAVNQAHFFSRAICLIAGGGAAGVWVAGVLYGIEPDGQIHT